MTHFASARLVHGVVRRRGLVLAVTGVVLAGSIVLALRLRLVTDFAALLPKDSPAVVATQRVQDRLGGVTPLEIAIESPDRAANLAFAQAVTAALSREPRSVIAQVAYNIHAERAFIQHDGWLYISEADLALVRERLEREVRWRKNPLLVNLEDDRESLDQLDARIKARARKADRFPDGYFMSPDGRLVVVMVWPAEALFREHAGEQLVARIRTIVDALPRPPALRVGYAGSLADAITERRALESDLAWASLACVVLVSLAVALFFGRLVAVPLMAAPGFIGVAVAFAVGSLAFGQLNASTAFLGSIILGNGINAAIIQLAHYEEERRAGAEVALAIERSVTGTARATGIAALAAAIAYGSLMLTRFRGFSQFGAIGAVGMITAWLATLVVLPALIATIDRSRARPRRGIAFGAPFATLAGRAPARVAAVAGLVTITAVVVLVPYARDPFEYDLRRLRSLHGVEQHALGRRIEAIFGTLTPTVLLADRAEQTAEVAQVLRARRVLVPGVIDEIHTLDDVLPGSPDEQRRKLAVIADIRAYLDEALPELGDHDRARLEKWLPPTNLDVITVAQLPDSFVRPFRAVGGGVAPVVLVYRDARISYWNGHDLLRLAGLVHAVELHDGTAVHAAGNAVVFGGMLEAIERDGPLATLISLLGVIVLVIVLARRGAVAVIAALVTGVVWMAGTAAVIGQRVNFLNFIALPLTFGIGVDYAINVYLRYRRERDIVTTLRATGGAVALCSLTTTIGYASLLFADSQGLRSFGTLAILGELACVSVALLVMPAWLILRARR